VLKPENIIFTKTTGRFNYEQVLQMTVEVFDLAVENDIRNVLGDHRDLSPDVTTTEIYALPRELLTRLERRHLKLALIYRDTAPKEADFRFFETTARNAGMNVKLFTTPEEGLAWLRER